MQNQIQNKLIELIKLSPDELKKVAELYCLIWREPPWNEDFWTIDGVLEDMKNVFKMSFFRAFVACSKKKIVGFTWGYQVSESEMQKICGNGELNFLFRTYKIFYIAEVGVDSSARKIGLGKRMTNCLIKLAKKDGADAIVLRTDINAYPARELYRSLGFSEVWVTDNLYRSRTYWLLVL